MQIDCEKLKHNLWDKGVKLGSETIYGMCAALNIDKNMMFSGPPGTAKTMTAKALGEVLFGDTKNKFFRITGVAGLTKSDMFGDWNYPKQFLEVQALCGKNSCPTGVVQTVYRPENFEPGPAVKALQNNGILFVDEVNRAGEDFQNLLLEVAEEHQVTIPMLGQFKGKPLLIVTYNEQDIGTEPLSNAFQRRFMKIRFKNPNQADMEEIMERKHPGTLSKLNTIIDKVM